MPNLPAHLTPSSEACARGECCCMEPVAPRAETGRWYITLGHAGFNTAANNGRGYATRLAAIRAFERCRLGRR